MSVLKPRRLALSVAALTAAAALLLGPAGPARAAEITVDTLDAAKSTDQNCALIEAIEAANTNTAVDACAAGSSAGRDRIVIDVAGEIDAPSNGFQIRSDMEIQGASGAGTTINGEYESGGQDVEASTGFRVNIDSPTVTRVTLSDMTVTNMADGIGVRLPEATNTKDPPFSSS